MKINVLRFADVDTIDVTIKTKVTGTDDVKASAKAMSDLDDASIKAQKGLSKFKIDTTSIKQAKTQITELKNVLVALSNNKTSTLKNELTKIKAAFDSVGLTKKLPTDVTKSMQLMSTLFGLADKPKQLDKTLKNINNLVGVYDTFDDMRGISNKDDTLKGDYTTSKYQSITGVTGPVKELTVGFKSLLAQEKENIDVLSAMYTSFNNIGNATQTTKTRIADFSDAVRINVSELEKQKALLENTSQVTKSYKSALSGGDVGVTSLLATTGSLDGSGTQFKNLTTYSNESVSALLGVSDGLANVGNAITTTIPQVASYTDMIEAETSKLKENSEALEDNIRATQSHKSILSPTATEQGGAGSSMVSMAMGGYDASMIDVIKDTNAALNETGAVMTNVAGKSATLNDNIKQNKNVFSWLLGMLKKIPKNLSEVEKGFRSLSLVRLTYLWNAVKRVSSSLVQAVDNAADYEESLNLYKMSIGEKYIDNAEEWSKEITDKLMIDESELMQYMGTFNNLAEGLGVHKDDAYEMSKALTQLTYDMSSYLNIDPSAAATKLQSAMSGQARAIQGVGVAIQSASLQELAYELGIDKKVETMTQAEKTYLRYIQIMRSTEHMQGDLGATMITPANAIRILKTQINLLGRAIGQVLTPIIMKVLPWIMALTNWLTKAAQKLAAFLGYKIQDVDMGDAFYNASDAVEDYADSAEDASKKVKNSLAPFDELNVVMSSSGSAGDISDSSVLDILRQEVEGYDMLERYTDDLKKKAEELEGALFPLFAAIGIFAGGKKIWDLVTGFGKLGTSMGDAAWTADKLKNYLGGLAKIGAIAISVAVIISCGKKIYDDVQSLKADIQDAVNPETEKKQSGEVKSNLDSLNDDIANGTVGENTQKHVDSTIANIKQINANLDGVQSQFKGTNAIMNSIMGTSGDWKKRLDEVLARYTAVNKQTRTLLDNTELTEEQAKSVRSALRDQRDALKEQLTHLTKGSDKYKATEKALSETKDLIGDINDKYFPKTESATDRWFGKTNETKSVFEKIRDDTDTISGNVNKTNETLSISNEKLEGATSKTSLWSKLTEGVKKLFNLTNTEASTVNETLSVSETNTGLFGKAISFVKGLFPGIKSEIDTVNDSLKTSDTKTGTWKDSLASVEGTIVGKITKPFNDFLSKFTTKKTFSVDTKTAKTNVEDVVNKSNKLNTTKTLKLDVDTKKANSGLSSLFGKDSLLGKLASKVGLDVDFFADGGYPTSGELFFANENGRAEFITSIGNRTAVANQDQMVQALTNAIMAGFAMTSPRGESKQPINVNIGNERVYSGVIDYQNRQSDRYGTTTTINV